MDVSDIATDEYVRARPDETVGELRSTFEDANPGGILVVEDGECVGVITPQELLRSQTDDETAARQVMKAVPVVDRTEGVREVARLLVENETRVAPVSVEGELWGGVTQDAILEAVLENLDVLTVKEIATQNVVTVTEDDTLSEAINLLREHGISRLPVVENGHRPIGIVTADDLVEFVVRDTRKQSVGDRGGDSPTLRELPVENVMDRPPKTTTLESTVSEAVSTMLEQNVDGLVVVPEYDERVTGVLTKTDVMRALSYTREEVMDVQITNIDLLHSTSREEIAERLEEITGKHRKLDVHHVHVRFQEHEEELRGRSLVRCQVRMWTDQEELAGTGEGYGGDEALSIALDKLERNVLELKGERSDEEYRGQLLRTLDEL
ncbi:CBS domain-containing protein [Halalkalicoccus ordinarius]|uniref:CBS domain-containing protein n=1 Tax=Halalkalicoccus ordinarius TaxID=3116651 RepID=UPI00300F7ADB